MANDLRKITKQKEIWGHPLSDFRECCTLCADFWIWRGQVFMDGMGGGATPIKIRPSKVRRRDTFGSLYRKCDCGPRFATQEDK